MGLNHTNFTRSAMSKQAAVLCVKLPDRLMVGLWFLAPAIEVRILVGQLCTESA
jgi:hypothetical protein